MHARSHPSSPTAPSASRSPARLTAEHAQRNQAYLSVPVFGRPEHAEAKQLVVLAAGPAELIDRCRPLFDAIGRASFVVGPEPWQANVAKLCGNFMIIGMIEAFGEAYATLRKAGVAPQAFLEPMNALLGSPILALYGRIVAEERFDPAGFRPEAGPQGRSPGPGRRRGMRRAHAACQLGP